MRVLVLFSQVAVFRGGWTAEATAEVAGAALVEKSLVRLSSAEPRALAERAGPNAADPLSGVVVGRRMVHARPVVHGWLNPLLSPADGCVRRGRENLGQWPVGSSMTCQPGAASSLHSAG